MKKKLLFLNYFVFVVGILLSDSLFAQPAISISRLGINWPEITIWFSAKCDSIQRYDVTKQNLFIAENDIEIDQYQILCPDSSSINKECSIKYDSHCKDGTRRNVGLTLLNLTGCPGIPVTAIRSYKAPLDTSTFIPISLRLGQETVKGRQTVDIPLLIDTPLNGELFNKMTFKILFDEYCFSFQNIITNGYLLDSVSIDAFQTQGGYLFQTTRSKQLYNTGILALLRFMASDPEQDRECPLKLSKWMFEAGCFRPVLSDGKISIEARKPIMDCIMDAPTQLTFDSTSAEYSPNPFAAIIQVVNNGDREGRNGVATISYNKNDIILVSPLSPKQPINPKITKDSGGISTARWDLFANKRSIADSITIGIDVTFDNHTAISCSRKIFIPASPLMEVENIDLRSTSFYSGQNYPNPFSTSTTIDMRYNSSSTDQSSITLKVFDLLGREVLDLSDKIIDNWKLTIDNSQLPKAGVYIYRLQNGNEMISRKMILIE